MQQQLLELMEMQIKDYDAALGFVDDDTECAQLQKFFGHEADILSTESRNLGSALYAPRPG